MMPPRLYELGGQYLEVRCCCQAQKLLGWLPVPVHVRPRPGVVVAFITEPRLEWRVWGRAVPPGHAPLEFVTHRAEHVSLPIREVYHSRRLAWPAEQETLVERHVVNRWLAFSSEETPLEKIRRIPGFVEARIYGA